MMYDYLPGLQVIFTGSSILDIYKGQADLSRRAVLYHLNGLSFREFIAMKLGKTYSSATIDDIIGNKVKIDEQPLPLFKEYLQTGYYPYFLEDNYFEINKYTFEVGGSSKKSNQIKGIPDSFIVKDDIEYGIGNIFPLWTMGFLY